MCRLLQFPIAIKMRDMGNGTYMAEFHLSESKHAKAHISVYWDSIPIDTGTEPAVHPTSQSRTHSAQSHCSTRDDRLNEEPCLPLTQRSFYCFVESLALA
jgi:hypothetical protein